MSKSLKLKNNNYWDTKGIVHNKKFLNQILDNIEVTNLFEGKTQSEITLAESVENFDYIEILHSRGENTNGYSTTRIYKENIKSIGLYENYCGKDEFSSITSTLVSITGKKLSFIAGKVLSFTKTGNYLAYSTDVTSIYRVDGFKINWK